MTAPDPIMVRPTPSGPCAVAVEDPTPDTDAPRRPLARGGNAGAHRTIKVIVIGIAIQTLHVNKEFYGAGRDLVKRKIEKFSTGLRPFLRRLQYINKRDASDEAHVAELRRAAAVPRSVERRHVRRFAGGPERAGRAQRGPHQPPCVLARRTVNWSEGCCL